MRLTLTIDLEDHEETRIERILSALAGVDASVQHIVTSAMHHGPTPSVDDDDDNTGVDDDDQTPPPPDLQAFTQGGDNSPELDEDGLPWDERIHSSGQAKTTKGKWKKKRGVDKKLVDEVEAELKANQAPPASPSPATPAPPPPPGDNTQTPPPPPAANGNGNDVLDPPADGWTWPAVLQATTKATTAGQISPTIVNEALAAIGVNSYPELATQPDKFELFIAQLKERRNV